jgi:DNA-binding NarL/FixJ family response regulator
MPLIILVADDNLGTRLSVSDYLEMSGYSVIVAEDGQEALSKIEKYHPHLLVTDINMPRMDGYELVKKLRQQPSFRLLPIVLLTERSTTKERIEGYESGCDVYLPKPFEMDELGAVIRNLVERQLDRKVSFPDSRTASDRPSDWDSPSTQENMPGEAIAPNSIAIELTEREKEVLVLLAIGLSNVEIGKKLYRSPRTVEKHVSSLLRKTETSNRAELIRFALKNHLVN